MLPLRVRAKLKLERHKGIGRVKMAECRSQAQER